MIEHIWTVLCSRSVIDSETNNVSIQDVIEQITINAEPAQDGFLPIPFELITLCIRKESNKPAKGNERITFVTPSGKSDIVAEGVIDLSSTERFRHRVKFPGLPLSEAGRYFFIVDIKDDSGEWQKVATIPLTIAFQPANTA
jgi:hypothetical protein